jgi:hypothetical protein
MHPYLELGYRVRQICVQSWRHQIMLVNGRHDMASLPETVAAPATPLQGNNMAQISQALSSICCSRCLRKFKTRSALLRHLQSKLTECPVAVDAGGVDVPRSVLLDMAHRRAYDSSRRCTGLAAVCKAVQQHRLTNRADARSFHLSQQLALHMLRCTFQSTY